MPPKNASIYTENQQLKSVYMFAKHIHNIYTGRHALNIYKMSNNTL